MRNISKIQKKAKHAFCFQWLFRNLCCLWDNVGKYDPTTEVTGDNIIRRTKKNARTQTHSENIILIAFPLQQWLHGNVSLLRYTFSVCLLSCYFAVFLPDFVFKFYCTLSRKCGQWGRQAAQSLITDRNGTKKKIRKSPGIADCDGSIVHPQGDRGVVMEHRWNDGGITNNAEQTLSQCHSVNRCQMQ